MWTAPTYKTTKVTIELRDIVDNGDNSVDIWDFDYPSYYEGDEKKAFERKFIDHYYFRQIGQETVGRWLHFFRSRIREIMPYYIQMYRSVEIMEGISDPFGNVDITETFKQTTSGQQQSEDTSESSGTSKDEKAASENKEHRFSNTPQGSIDNLDNFLTEVFTDDNTSTETINTTTSGNSSGNSSLTTQGTTEHTYTKKGNQGVNTYAHDMIEYRKSFLNVDMMIIESLNDLFLGVY